MGATVDMSGELKGPAWSLYKDFALGTGIDVPPWYGPTMPDIDRSSCGDHTESSVSLEALGIAVKRRDVRSRRLRLVLQVVAARSWVEEHNLPQCIPQPPGLYFM